MKIFAEDTRVYETLGASCVIKKQRPLLSTIYNQQISCAFMAGE